MQKFHCFYRERVGGDHKYVVHDTEEPVLELVRQANPAPHEYSNIANLVVIYGMAVKFEPAKWVESWKIVDEG